MRRTHLLMLIWTGLWVIALLLGVAIFFAGLTGPDIDSSQREWFTYPAFNSNWEFGAGIMIAGIAVIAALVDGVARLVLLTVWAVRRSSQCREGLAA